jgi:hypothetical protein
VYSESHQHDQNIHGEADVLTRSAGTCSHCAALCSAAVGKSTKSRKIKIKMAMKNQSSRLS